MDTVLSILHVVCAVFIVGPMAILPMTAMRAVRAGDGAQVARFAKVTNLFSLLSLLVLIFGFGAMGMSKYDIAFSDTWIWLSIVLYVIALGLSLFMVVPTLKKAAAQLTSTTSSADAAAPAATSGYGAIMAGSGIASLCLLVVVILMVWKP